MNNTTLSADGDFTDQLDALTNQHRAYKNAVAFLKRECPSYRPPKKPTSDQKAYLIVHAAGVYKRLQRHAAGCEQGNAAKARRLAERAASEVGVQPFQKP